RGHYACCPYDCVRLDALVAERDAAIVAGRHRASEPHFNAELFKAALGSGESNGSKDGSTRGPASIRMIRALAGSMVLKSFARAFFASSAIAPAISAPVGP